MNKIKKIILIVVSFVVFILTLSIITAILDNGNLEVDKSIISKKSELLRKNTFCFYHGLENLNSDHKSYYINLNYVYDITAPVEYYYPEKHFNEGFWEGANFKNYYEYVFTIEFINGESINITNMLTSGWSSSNGYIAGFNFRENEFSRFEIVAEKMRNNKTEPIDYSFKIKSSTDKNYTELNFKDIIYFVSEINSDDLSYLYFYSVKSPYKYKFTFDNEYEAETIIYKLKGYKKEELNHVGLLYYTNIKPDDYRSMWNFASEEDFKSKYNVDKYFNYNIFYNF